MSSVWLSRFSRWLEALNNAKGGPVLLDIEPNLTAVAAIMEGNEDRFLQGWGRYGIMQGLTGAAGNNAGVELHNPAGSNVVGVVEMITCRAAGASTFTVTLTPGPAGIGDFGVVQAQKLDGRQNTNSSLVFSTSTSAVGFINAIMSGQPAAAGASYQFIQTVNQEITLLPASALIVADNTQAEFAQFSLMWRERPLQQSELT